VQWRSNKCLPATTAASDGLSFVCGIPPLADGAGKRKRTISRMKIEDLSRELGTSVPQRVGNFTRDIRGCQLPAIIRQ
jgi:hypothetical protein